MNRIYLEQFGVKYQTILASDSISRFYNYKRGDIIRILRQIKNENDKKQYIIAYRIVKG